MHLQKLKNSLIAYLVNHVVMVNKRVLIYFILICLCVIYFLIVDDFMRLDVTDFQEGDEKLSTSILCRTIRIGSYKFDSKEKVSVNLNLKLCHDLIFISSEGHVHIERNSYYSSKCEESQRILCYKFAKLRNSSSYHPF